MKVVAFGELMLRLSPPGVYRLIQADSLIPSYTGAEANACVFLGMNGVETQFVTKLPDAMMTEVALSSLRKYRVGTDNVTLGGPRMGVYYLERGASQRPSRLQYDRKYSSISLATPEDFNWDRILEGADVLMLTGVTPALGGRLPEICLDACQMARRKKAKVFLDLNYRSSLWTPEEAQSVMKRIAPYVDVLIGNEEDAEKSLGLKAGHTDVTGGRLDREGYEEIGRRIHEAFDCKAVAFTLRISHSASDNGWSAMLYTGGKALFSRQYEIHLVDRVGGGDSFTSGLIYSYLHGFEPQKALEFATAASCLKQSVELDFNLSKSSEVLALMSGDASGRVQR